MLKDESLAGKVAIVTGGGTGLGKEIARKFVVNGMKVVLASRRKEVLEQTAKEIDPQGNQTLVVPMDTRNILDIGVMIDQTQKQFGTIDVLVNNAAGNFLCPSIELSVNGWKSVIETVLNGTFFCSQSVGKTMIAKGKGGAIVNIVASYAWGAEPGVIHSAAAKAGVVAVTKTLAVEWAPYGIRVNAVSPGPFESEGTRKFWANELLAQAIQETVPMKRFARTEEIANAALFLISSYARYVTGEILVVDGGQGLVSGARGFMEAMAFTKKIKQGRH